MASSFSSKLSRLRPLAGGAHGEPASVDAASGAVAASAQPAGRAQAPSLDELRDRIAKMMRGSGVNGPPSVALPPRPIAPRGEPVELPFVREETPLGVLDRAARRVRGTYRVGQVEVAPAATADASLLALLALDPSLAGLDPRRALYLDTETTGLSHGAGTVAFLVGLAFFDESGELVLEQVLLRELGSEAPLVAHVARRLEEASFVVSFNGKSFDLPLLRSRAVMARAAALPERPHLDLLHVARRLHGHRLGSTSLRVIEEQILGAERVDDVAGADVALAYLHWLRVADDAVLAPVVQHNALDVLSMLALVGLYGEPMTSLAPSDLVAAARVVGRAGDPERAASLLEVSLARGAGAGALVARGDLSRARGDRARAILDYEAALASGAVDARACLSLAKLYEHHEKCFDKALATLAQGTTEAPAAHERRVERLRTKQRRALARGGS